MKKPKRTFYAIKDKKTREIFPTLLSTKEEAEEMGIIPRWEVTKVKITEIK